MTRKLSEETRRKISETIKKRWTDQEYRRKMVEPRKGKTFSEEHRMKLSLAMKGIAKTEEHKRKLSLALKGRPKSEETKKKIGEASKGRIPWNKGKKHSEEHKRKTSLALTGKKRTPEQCKAISNRLMRDKNPSWRGGISFEPYCPKFNEAFRERVREFFGRVCVECGTPENGRKMCVHHVNFNKMVCCDGTPPIFVPLCNSCHSKTNYDREYWEEHFTNMVMTYYEGRCYI